MSPSSTASHIMPGAQDHIPKPHLPIELWHAIYRELFASEYEDSIHHVCPHMSLELQPTALQSLEMLSKELPGELSEEFYNEVSREFYSRQPVNYTLSWDDFVKAGWYSKTYPSWLPRRGDEDFLQNVELTVIASCSSILQHNCSWCTLASVRSTYQRNPRAVAPGWNRSVPLWREHNDGNFSDSGPTDRDMDAIMAENGSIRMDDGTAFLALKHLTLRFVTQYSDDIWSKMEDPLLPFVSRLSSLSTLAHPPKMEIYGARGKPTKTCESLFDLGVPMAFINRTLSGRPMQWIVNPPLLHVKGKALHDYLDSGYTLHGLKALINDNGGMNAVPEREKEVLWGVRETSEVVKVECLELWGDSKDGDKVVLEHLREEAKKAWEVVKTAVGEKGAQKK